MKKFVGIALVLALVLSTAAMAEGTTDPIPAAEVPAVEAQAPAEEAQAPAATPEQTEDEQKALQDAMDAYRAAKQDKAVDDLETELKGYVEAGSLTQEQADLILKNVKERVSEKNGECPNCGYDLRSHNKGGKGQRGQCGQQRGQMPGMNGQQRGNQMRGQQRPDAQSGATPKGPMNGQHGQQNGQMPQNGNQMPQQPDAQNGTMQQGPQM